MRKEPNDYLEAYKNVLKSQQKFGIIRPHPDSSYVSDQRYNEYINNLPHKEFPKQPLVALGVDNLTEEMLLFPTNYLASIGIIAEERSGRHFLQQLVKSMAVCNGENPQNICFYVISDNPKTWRGTEQWENCAGIYRSDGFHVFLPRKLNRNFPSYNNRTDGLINGLADIAFQYKKRRKHGPDYVLAVDNLASLFRTATPHTMELFRRLVREGAGKRIYVMSVIPHVAYADLGFVHDDTSGDSVQLFPSVTFGKIENVSNATQIYGEEYGNELAGLGRTEFDLYTPTQERFRFWAFDR